MYTQLQHVPQPPSANTADVAGSLGEDIGKLLGARSRKKKNAKINDMIAADKSAKAGKNFEEAVEKTGNLPAENDKEFRNNLERENPYTMDKELVEQIMKFDPEGGEATIKNWLKIDNIPLAHQTQVLQKTSIVVNEGAKIAQKILEVEDETDRLNMFSEWKKQTLKSGDLGRAIIDSVDRMLGDGKGGYKMDEDSLIAMASMMTSMAEGVGKTGAKINSEQTSYQAKRKFRDEDVDNTLTSLNTFAEKGEVPRALRDDVDALYRLINQYKQKGIPQTDKKILAEKINTANAKLNDNIRKHGYGTTDQKAIDERDAEYNKIQEKHKESLIAAQTLDHAQWTTKIEALLKIEKSVFSKEKGPYGQPILSEEVVNRHNARKNILSFMATLKDVGDRGRAINFYAEVGGYNPEQLAEYNKNSVKNMKRAIKISPDGEVDANSEVDSAFGGGVPDHADTNANANSVEDASIDSATPIQSEGGYAGGGATQSSNGQREGQFDQLANKLSMSLVIGSGNVPDDEKITRAVLKGLGVIKRINGGFYFIPISPKSGLYKNHAKIKIKVISKIQAQQMLDYNKRKNSNSNDSTGGVDPLNLSP